MTNTGTALPIYDPSITCATRVFYGMSMCLTYQFGADKWELLTRTNRTGLAKYRPSKFDRLPDVKPETFMQAALAADTFLSENCTAIWADDRERMTETGADYLR